MPSIIQPSFAHGEVSPDLAARVDTAAYKSSLRTARNVIIRPYGGASNRPGLQFINFAKTMSGIVRLRRFRFKTTDTYMLEFSDLAMRVIRADAYMTEATKTILGVTHASLGVVNVTAHGYSAGQDLELVTNGRLNGRRVRVKASVDADHFSLTDIMTGADLDTTTFTDSSGTSARVYTVVTPWVEADLFNLAFNQSADVITATHPSYAPREISRTGDTAWTVTTPTYVPTQAAPTITSVVANGTTGSQAYSYVVTAVSASGEESLISNVGVIVNSNDTALDNTVTWTSIGGATLYNVYRAVNGINGFIGQTVNLTFRDTNFAPVLSITPPSGNNPFNAAGLYPGASSYYQQRIVYGGSTSLPDTMDFSKIGYFHNFSKSNPVQDDDAIRSTLTSREMNQIRFFLPAKDLLVFTAGGEWRINSNGSSGFSASTISQFPQSTWGCGHLEPQVFGLTTLFAPENARFLRSLEYTYVSDNYTGDDVTVLANHLFKDFPMVDMSSGRSPDPLLYGIRSDGYCCVLTYQKEQQVIAWARWNTLGQFKAVDVIRPFDAEPDDIPYFVVRRFINGHTVQYVERAHSRRFTDVRDCFFVDAGLTFNHPITITAVSAATPYVITAPSHGFSGGETIDISDIVWVSNFDELDNETQPDQLNNRRLKIGTVADANNFQVTDLDGNVLDGAGTNAYLSGGYVRKAFTTFSGLDHLEGMPLAVLADGNVVPSMTVSGGSITLPRAASRVSMGLKYTSDLETLNNEIAAGGSTIQGDLKKISTCTIRFSRSRGLFVGISSDALDEVKQRQFENMGDPTALLDGDLTLPLPSDWEQNGRVFARQRDPLPMNVLAFIPDLDIGGT